MPRVLNSRNRFRKSGGGEHGTRIYIIGFQMFKREVSWVPSRKFNTYGEGVYTKKRYGIVLTQAAQPSRKRMNLKYVRFACTRTSTSVAVINDRTRQLYSPTKIKTCGTFG